MVSLSILRLTVLPLCLLYEQMTCSNLSVLLRNNLSKYCALNFFEQLLHQNISVSHTHAAIKKKKFLSSHRVQDNEYQSSDGALVMKDMLSVYLQATASIHREMEDCA